MENTQYKEILKNNNIQTSVGIHGQIFAQPWNKGNYFEKSFNSYKQAYEHYTKAKLIEKP